VRAALVEQYGGPEVVVVREVPDPRPGPRQVLVRVRSAAVTSGDARIRGARFPDGFGPFARLAFGIRRPRRPILGGALSGTIEAIGAKVEGWSVGDQVCAMNGLAMGGHAELVAVDADRLAAKPPAITHDQAAGVLFGGTTALHFLHRKLTVAPGTSVLVIGASGAVGTNAVQLARLAGGTVTGVCSARNAALVERLGATRTIDHATVDLSTIPDRFDIVLDAVGTLTIAAGRQLLAPGGHLALAVGTLGQTVRARGDVVAGSGAERAQDFAHLVDLVATDQLEVVIERTVLLDQIVEAHRLVDTGRKVGNVLVHP
jgi:NADPH:quinone reductase-like Zn-dependent oxidoreductase